MTLENELENIKKGQIVGFDTNKLKAIGVKETTVIEGGELTKTNGFVEEEQVSAIEVLENLEQLDLEPSKPAEPTPAVVPDVITAEPVNVAPVDPLSTLLVETPEEKKEEPAPVAIPELQIQLPVMNDEVLATEPQGIDEGLFAPEKSETKFEDAKDSKEEVKEEKEILNVEVKQNPNSTKNDDISAKIKETIEEYKNEVQKLTDKLMEKLDKYIKSTEELYQSEIKTATVTAPEEKKEEGLTIPSLDAFVDPTSLINGIQESGPKL